MPCVWNISKRLLCLAETATKQPEMPEQGTAQGNPQDIKHNYPVAENLINQNFTVSRPNQVWVADITCIPTDEGWLYLAAIEDLFQRKIVGWAMDTTMNRQLVLNALRQAVWRYRPSAGLIHHSDRGSQYASHEYQKALKDYEMVTSMSRKGNCFDNACIESFFGTLKRELTCWRHLLIY